MNEKNGLDINTPKFENLKSNNLKVKAEQMKCNKKILYMESDDFDN